MSCDKKKFFAFLNRIWETFKKCFLIVKNGMRERDLEYLVLTEYNPDDSEKKQKLKSKIELRFREKYGLRKFLADILPFVTIIVIVSYFRSCNNSTPEEAERAHSSQMSVHSSTSIQIDYDIKK